MKQAIITTLILLLIGSCSICYSEVTIDPIGIAVVLDHEDNDTLVSTITLHNATEDDHYYKIGLPEDRLESDNDERLTGSFQGPNRINEICSPIGWDLDNEWMWIICHVSGEVTAWSHNSAYDEFEQQAEFNLDERSCLEGAWGYGTVYICDNTNSREIKRYDAEGNRVGTIEFDYVCQAVGIDEVEGWLFALEWEHPYYPIHVYSLDGDGIPEEEIGELDSHHGYHDNQIVLNLEWVPSHRDVGQLWMNSHDRRSVYQIMVDTERWRCVNSDNTVTFQMGLNYAYDAFAHDGNHFWAGGFNRSNIRIYSDGYAELFFNHMVIRENRGFIVADDYHEFELLLTAGDLASGSYSCNIETKFYDNENYNGVLSSVKFSVILTVDDDVFSLVGAVTDSSTSETIEGVCIGLDNYYFARFSNGEGAYSIANLPLNSYAVTATARDYLPHTEEIVVEESGEFELNFALLQAECVLGPDTVASRIQTGDSTDVEIEVNNPGNGSLTFSVRTESELDSLEWMRIAPDSGVVEPDSSAIVTLVLKALDLPEAAYNGELIFEHDGIGGQTTLPVTMEVIPLGIADNRKASHREFALDLVYPNPFNSSTTITYSLPVAASVTLQLFDLSGREIRTLVEGEKQAGVHRTMLNAANLPSGVYFVRLEATEQVQTRKVMLIR